MAKSQLTSNLLYMQSSFSLLYCNEFQFEKKKIIKDMKQLIKHVFLYQYFYS